MLTAMMLADSSHLRRTYLQIPVTSIEISGTHMVLVMKLTTFAWNVHDGRQKPDVG
jgi:lysophospholipid acyltransferase